MKKERLSVPLTCITKKDKKGKEKRGEGGRESSNRASWICGKLDRVFQDFVNFVCGVA